MEKKNASIKKTLRQVEKQHWHTQQWKEPQEHYTKQEEARLRRLQTVGFYLADALN